MNHIPFDITFHPQWWNNFAGVSFKEEFFTDYRYRIEQDIKMRKTLYKYFGQFGFGEENPEPRPIIDTEFVAGEYLQALLLGCEIRYFDESYPETICMNISDEDVKKLVVPDLDKIEAWNNIEKQMAILTDEYGYVESHLDLHGVQNLALDLRGQQLFIDYYTSKDIARKLLSVCTDLIIEVAKRVEKYSKTLSAGVTSIMKQINPKMFVTSNCTVEMVSNEIYEEFLLEFDEKISNEFKDFGIHHCGKTTEHVAQGYSKVKNLSFVEVGAFSDIRRVRDVFLDIHLNLRYSPVRLKEVSMEQVDKDIRHMIEDGRPLNKVSVSCVGIDAETPIEKVINFIEGVKYCSENI